MPALTRNAGGKAQHYNFIIDALKYACLKHHINTLADQGVEDNNALRFLKS
jgi:hypothetical protein